MTITLPPDLESWLAEEAFRRGTSTETLAHELLRNHFGNAPPPAPLTDKEFESLLQEIDEIMAPALEGLDVSNLPLTREEIYGEHP